MARKNPPIAPEIEESIREGMARSLWVNAYASFMDELDDEDNDEEWPRVGRGEDWDDVAPVTPRAAEQAAKDLVMLYHQAEGFPKNTTDETMTLLFSVAAEADTGEMLEMDVSPDAVYNLAATYTGRPVPLSVLETRKSVVEVAREFGWGMANHAMGSGSSWFDHHKQKNAKGLVFTMPRVTFECHFDGQQLTWSGRVMEKGASGDVFSGQGLYDDTTGPRMESFITSYVGGELSGREMQPVNRYPTPMTLTEQQTLLGWSIVDATLDWLADQIDKQSPNDGYEFGDRSSRQGLPADQFFLTIEGVRQGARGSGNYSDITYVFSGYTAEQRADLEARVADERWTPEPTQIGDITVVNPHESGNGMRRYIWSFGQMDATNLMAYADDEEASLEMCVEWLAEHAPGLLADESVNEEFKRLEAEAVIERDRRDPSKKGWGLDEHTIHALREEAEMDTSMVGDHYLGVDEFRLLARLPSWAGSRTTEKSTQTLLEISRAEELAIEREESRQYNERMARLRQPRIWRDVASADSRETPSVYQERGEAIYFQPSSAVAQAVRLLSESGPLDAHFIGTPINGDPIWHFQARNYYLSPITGGQRTLFLLDNFTNEQQREVWETLQNMGAITSARPRRNPCVPHARR